MATVRIPPVLRPRTGGESEVDAAGETVGEALRALADAHPDTGDQLFGENGELNRYVNVYLNDEDVRVLDGLDTAVSEGDTVVILPAMAGGAARSRPPEVELVALSLTSSTLSRPRGGQAATFHVAPEGARAPRHFVQYGRDLAAEAR